MKSKTPKSFSFKLKWHEILKAFDPALRCEVYDAVFDYVASGETYPLSAAAEMAFAFIKYEIDSHKRRSTGSSADEAADSHTQTPEPTEESDALRQEQQPSAPTARQLRALRRRQAKYGNTSRSLCHSAPPRGLSKDGAPMVHVRAGAMAPAHASP